jgi:hypothetical protein
LLVRGYTADLGARLHAELALHPASGPDQPLGSLDSAAAAADAGFHLQAWIDGTLCVGTLAPQPGDGLLLTITYASGAADFTVLETTMSVP